MNQEEWRESKIISLENEVDCLKIKAKNMLSFLEDLFTSIRIFINDESDIGQLKSNLSQKLHCIDEFINKEKEQTFISKIRASFNSQDMEPIQLEPFCEGLEESKTEISRSYHTKNEMEKEEMLKGLKKTIVGGRQFIRQLSKPILEEETKEIPIPENNNNANEDKLFENFVVIGPKKNNIFNIAFEKEDVIMVEPSVIFDFTASKAMTQNKDVNSILPFFCYPEGLKIQPISQKSINFILTEKGDRKDLYADYAIFALRNKIPGQEDFGNEIMKEMNPEKLLFCYTLKFQSIDKNKEKKYFKSHLSLVLMSYFPFSEFFFRLLKEILLEIQLLRLGMFDFDALNKKNSNSEQNLPDLLNNILKNKISLTLEHLLMDFSFPNEKNEIKISLLADYTEPLRFYRPANNLLFQESYAWFAGIVFSNIPFYDFFFLLIAFLLEKNIVLYSSEQNLLTYTIEVLTKIIHPLYFQAVTISTLPESLYETLDAPVPFLIGLNLNHDKLLIRFDLEERKERAVFYDLDNYDLHCGKILLEEIKSKLPKFQKMEKEMKRIYKTICSKKSKTFSFFPGRSPKHSNAGALLDTKNIYQIINIVNGRIRNNFLDKIPNNAVDINQIKLELLEQCKVKEDKEFMRGFLETQTATYFIQLKVENNMQSESGAVHN